MFLDRPHTTRPEPRDRIAELTEQLEADGALPNTIISALIDAQQRLVLREHGDPAFRPGRRSGARS